MSSHSLNIPVLFLVFNRLDTTKLVFEVIRLAKPPRLYISADGARASRTGELEEVEAVRNYIMGHIDWECEVKTLFRDQNLGCKYAVSGAIDWFFEQEEMGVILEDDCLPDPTFFYFCQLLLERYRHDQRIGMISGDNFQFGRRRNDDSYYFSKYTHIWGWASWRDRWVGSYDVAMTKWPLIREEGWLADMVGSRKEASYWQIVFDRVFYDDFNSWAYPLVFCNFLEGRVNVMPNQNMITNLGFNESATHTTGTSDLAALPRNSVEFPLKHPTGIFVNKDADEVTRKKYFSFSKLTLLYRKIKIWLGRKGR